MFEQFSLVFGATQKDNILTDIYHLYDHLGVISNIFNKRKINIFKQRCHRVIKNISKMVYFEMKCQRQPMKTF